MTGLTPNKNRIARDPTQKEGKGPNTRGFCKGCEKEVPRGRRCWCSEECIEEQLIRSSPAHAAYRVAQRDSGVCARCHIDTKRLASAMRWAEYVIDCWAGHRNWNPPDDDPGYRPHVYGRISRGFLSDMGFTKIHLWEMDHIVPVSEGGGECGLDNLRTLCIPCHKEVTAQLRGRLARAARVERRGCEQATMEFMNA